MVYDQIDMRRERSEGFADGFKIASALWFLVAFIAFLYILGSYP